MTKVSVKINECQLPSLNGYLCLLDSCIEGVDRSIPYIPSPHTKFLLDGEYIFPKIKFNCQGEITQVTIATTETPPLIDIYLWTVQNDMFVRKQVPMSVSNVTYSQCVLGILERTYNCSQITGTLQVNSGDILGMELRQSARVVLRETDKDYYIIPSPESCYTSKGFVKCYHTHSGDPILQVSYLPATKLRGEWTLTSNHFMNNLTHHFSYMLHLL